MTTAVQTSLFDLADEPAEGGFALGPLGGMVTRQVLGRGAWVDVLPGWLRGSSTLLDDLQGQVLAGRAPADVRRTVDVPRLVCLYGDGEPLPHPACHRARERLNEHYRAELGEPFVTAGMCLYRDGRD